MDATATAWMAAAAASPEPPEAGARRARLAAGEPAIQA